MRVHCYPTVDSTSSTVVHLQDLQSRCSNVPERQTQEFCQTLLKHYPSRFHLYKRACRGTWKGIFLGKVWDNLCRYRVELGTLQRSYHASISVLFLVTLTKLGETLAQLTVETRCTVEAQCVVNAPCTVNPGALSNLHVLSIPVHCWSSVCCQSSVCCRSLVNCRSPVCCRSSVCCRSPV